MIREDCRQLVITFLTDGEGMNETGWRLTFAVLTNVGGCEDIIHAVCCADGRYYLPDNWDQDLFLQQQEFRDLAISLLEDGVSPRSWKILQSLLRRGRHTDILSSVKEENVPDFIPVVIYSLPQGWEK